MPRNNRAVVHPTKEVAVLPKVSAATSPGLGQIVKEGMAFGVGNAVAHSVIGRLFGGSSSVAATPAAAPAAAPVSEKLQYTQCLELTKGNHEVCEHLL
jgi:hypothetical protein